MTDFDLSLFAVNSAGIPKAHYIPDFISEQEEAYLLRQIYNAPKPKWKCLENRRLQVWGGDLTPSNKLLAQALPPFLTEYPDIIGRLRSTGVFSNSRHGAPNHIIVNEYLPLQGIMPHEDGPSYHPVVATISLGSHTVFHYYRYKQDASFTTSASGAVQEDGVQNTDDKHTEPSVDTLSHSRTALNDGLEEVLIKQETRESRGRVIDMSNPVLSLFLEPRSLVITTRDLYTDHLHGIDPLSEDVFLPARTTSVSPDLGQPNCSSDELEGSVRVANWDIVKDPKVREVVRNGGRLKRGARISLTCRDVENVISVKSLR
ncbi:uncharacterized protein FOMMEDRAFT_18598 [Fomitiporia mediterranea MF3/22]|uniref:uncharacterized protein n=1 Tax=Fomitiporia mediterranea (strain MF3/22) TaxID=694068 RepID=UPI0004407DB0|nr:uncharacterized protein FOMMEDRAFT_18598 [Fomitiporia mediterranea MF3/22]EJD04874.1 hypothetical protein FOMMEDRAFT_18598 [Fomitiporia mediterranea MF3/22]